MSRQLIRMNILAFLVIGMCSFTSNGLYAQDAMEIVDPCSIPNVTFEDGEEIVYKLYYKMGPIWLSAGEVAFGVNEKENHYHLSAVGKTYPGYEWFFKVRDYYTSYIDKNTLLPDTSIRDVHEGSYTLYDKVTFDHQSNKAISERGRSKEKTKTAEVEMQDCMHDMLSCVYYIRNMNLNSFEEGQAFPINIFLDKKVYNLNVKYDGKEKSMKIRGLGKFDVIKVSPQLIAGKVFEEGEQMHVYVSDDANRIPLMITSPLSVGSIRAVLKSHSGLKYELDSAR